MLMSLICGKKDYDSANAYFPTDVNVSGNCTDVSDGSQFTNADGAIVSYPLSNVMRCNAFDLFSPYPSTMRI